MNNTKTNEQGRHRGLPLPSLLTPPLSPSYSKRGKGTLKSYFSGGRGRMPLRAIAIMLWIATLAMPTLFGGAAWALPQDGTVAAGGSTITQPDASAMNINQSTDKAIINWQGYGIGVNERQQKHWA